MHTRRHDLPFCWPDPPLAVALIHPEIPPNTGNIARLCAATGSPLHLIEPLGFKLTEQAVKRAGLDYWDAVDIQRYRDVAEFEATRDPQRMWLFSTGGTRSYLEIDYQPGDTLVFGSEGSGLPQALLDRYPGQMAGIPMRCDHVRSLNLASSVSIVLYEALRQLQK